MIERDRILRDPLVIIQDILCFSQLSVQLLADERLTIFDRCGLLVHCRSNQRKLEPRKVLVVGSDTLLYTFPSLFEYLAFVQDKLARDTMCTLRVFGVMEQIDNLGIISIGSFELFDRNFLQVS